MLIVSAYSLAKIARLTAHIIRSRGETLCIAARSYGLNIPHGIKALGSLHVRHILSGTAECSPLGPRRTSAQTCVCLAPRLTFAGLVGSDDALGTVVKRGGRHAPSRTAGRGGSLRASHILNIRAMRAIRDSAYPVSACSTHLPERRDHTRYHKREERQPAHREKRHVTPSAMRTSDR